jgi:hypothetical protein
MSGALVAAQAGWVHQCSRRPSRKRCRRGRWAGVGTSALAPGCVLRRATSSPSSVIRFSQLSCSWVARSVVFRVASDVASRRMRRRALAADCQTRLAQRTRRRPWLRAELAARLTVPSLGSSNSSAFEDGDRPSEPSDSGRVHWTVWTVRTVAPVTFLMRMIRRRRESTDPIARGDPAGTGGRSSSRRSALPCWIERRRSSPSFAPGSRTSAPRSM